MAVHFFISRSEDLFNEAAVAQNPLIAFQKDSGSSYGYHRTPPIMGVPLGSLSFASNGAPMTRPPGLFGRSASMGLVGSFFFKYGKIES